MKYDRQDQFPDSSVLVQELQRLKFRKRYFEVLRSTIMGLITAASAAIIIAIVLLPILQIYGRSMTPTLTEGNIVISIKGAKFDTGDVISFYHENTILVKRVIAFEGDWVDMDEYGRVYVNGVMLDEPYIERPAIGECDITLPYQVPDGQIFVMGDHRATSQDSRSRKIGCISEDKIVGKIVYRIWPLYTFGKVE